MTSKQASHSDLKFTTYAQWHGRRQKCIWPEISIWEYCITFEFSNHICSQKSGKLHSCGRWCKHSLGRVILVLKQIRRRRQRDVKKCLDWKSNTFAVCTWIPLFSTFICRHCTNTKWKCLISRFVQDVNSRQQLSLSFPELRRKICQHLKNWTGWNKRVR